MKKILILLLCINSLLVFTGSNNSENTEILDFKIENIKNIEMFHFNIPTEAKGMIITETEDFERIMKAFSEIKIERNATIEDETSGGEVISFRFNLKNRTEFVIAYWEGILRNPDGINYKVSANSLKALWDNLDYDKHSVNERDLPIINKR